MYMILKKYGKGVLHIYNDIVNLISSVGFPIVVAGYCLVTLNKTIEKMTETVNNALLTMTNSINDLIEKLDDKGGTE